MAKRIEDEFSAEQVDFVPIVWEFLRDNAVDAGWLLAADLMQPVYRLVLKDALDIAKYENVTDEDTLVLQFIKIILPLLQGLDAKHRADFAMGFMERVVDWYTED